MVNSTSIKYYASNRGGYSIAAELLAGRCRSVFLMQRSSTIILGPEDDWIEEQKFFANIKQTLKRGTPFRHIVSTSGIADHLRRTTSTFSKKSESREIYEVSDGEIKLICGDSYWPIKNIETFEGDPDFKVDRQARTLAVQEEDGDYSALVVANLGPVQSWFHIRGDVAFKYFEDCIGLYDSCLSLKEGELY